MQLNELYRRLSVGFLSNLAIGMDGAGDLSEKGKVATKVHLNTVLRSLSKRFVLREEVLILVLEEGRTRYELKPAFAQSQDNGGAGPYYIKDTVEEPFTDTVIKVLRVYGDNGYELSINEPDNPYCLTTPRHNILQIPAETGLEEVAVNYQTFLGRVADDADGTEEFDLPEVLEDPVCMFIAASIFASMNGQEHILKGKLIMEEYENEIQLITREDLLSVSSITYQDKFRERGFV